MLLHRSLPCEKRLAPGVVRTCVFAPDKEAVGLSTGSGTDPRCRGLWFANTEGDETAFMDLAIPAPLSCVCCNRKLGLLVMPPVEVARREPGWRLGRLASADWVMTRIERKRGRRTWNSRLRSPTVTYMQPEESETDRAKLQRDVDALPRIRRCRTGPVVPRIRWLGASTVCTGYVEPLKGARVGVCAAVS